MVHSERDAGQTNYLSPLIRASGHFFPHLHESKQKVMNGGLISGYHNYYLINFNSKSAFTSVTFSYLNKLIVILGVS